MLYIYGKSAVPQAHFIKRLNVTERSFSLPTTFWKTVLQFDQKSLKFYHQTSSPSVTFTLTCSIIKFYKWCAFIFRSFGAYRFILLCSIFSSSEFINKVRTYARVLMIRWLIETRDKDKTKTKERESKKTRVTSIGGSITCRERTRAGGARPRVVEEKEELAAISSASPRRSEITCVTSRCSPNWQDFISWTNKFAGYTFVYLPCSP